MPATVSLKTTPESANDWRRLSYQLSMKLNRRVTVAELLAIAAIFVKKNPKEFQDAVSEVLRNAK